MSNDQQIPRQSKQAKKLVKKALKEPPKGPIERLVDESWAQQFLFRTYMYLAFTANSWRDRIIGALNVLKKGLATETEQTKEMLQIYLRQSRGEATKLEKKRANKQFRDLVRHMGLGFLIILPFAPVTLPLIVKLGRQFGVEVLPDSYRELFK